MQDILRLEGLGDEELLNCLAYGEWILNCKSDNNKYNKKEVQLGNEIKYNKIGIRKQKQLQKEKEVSVFSYKFIVK